jgi:hypothetical protein
MQVMRHTSYYTTSRQVILAGAKQGSYSPVQDTEPEKEQERHQNQVVSQSPNCSEPVGDSFCSPPGCRPRARTKQAQQLIDRSNLCILRPIELG